MNCLDFFLRLKDTTQPTHLQTPSTTSPDLLIKLTDLQESLNLKNAEIDILNEKIALLESENAQLRRKPTLSEIMSSASNSAISNSVDLNAVVKRPRSRSRQKQPRELPRVPVTLEIDEINEKIEIAQNLMTKSNQNQLSTPKNKLREFSEIQCVKEVIEPKYSDISITELNQRTSVQKPLKPQRKPPSASNYPNKSGIQQSQGSDGLITFKVRIDEKQIKEKVKIFK